MYKTGTMMSNVKKCSQENLQYFDTQGGKCLKTNKMSGTWNKIG